MKKFVTCRIIDADDPAPSSQTAGHEMHSNATQKASGLRQRIVEIYQSGRCHGFRSSELNTVI